MNSIPDKLKKNEYYHGTESYKAIQILYEGFRLKKYYAAYGRGAHLTQGIYLTKSLSVAAQFSQIGSLIFKCRLKPSIPILWLNGDYDPKIINSLKREFSKEILTGNITKVLPRNKKLTKNELIHLLNYRFTKEYGRRKWWPRYEKATSDWEDYQVSYRQQLQRHHYEGFGETKDITGVVIFNPSLVEPIELYEAFRCGSKPCEDVPGYDEPIYSLRQCNKKKISVAIDQYYEEFVDFSNEENEALSPEDVMEWEHIRSLQKKYCQEHGPL